MVRKIFFCIAIIFCVVTFSGDNFVNRTGNVAFAQNHWIRDTNNGAYLWNPEPRDGESASWTGGIINVGGVIYAHGYGTLYWYRYGRLVQRDEGSFLRGRHHGRFKHTFYPSGNVEYSNWDNGVEI